MSFDQDKLGSAAFWDLLRDHPEKLAAEVCKIDLIDLERTLQRHPALRAWINAAHETAKISEERRKWELTKIKARVTLDAKGEDPDTGRAKTVDVLKAEVENHTKVEEAQEAYFQAMETRAALRAMADALEDRKDMLIQISARKRRESEDYG